MRFKPGRPDLTNFATRFDVPAAVGPFQVTFLGVSTLLVSDGESSLLTDGFFSRPSLATVALGKLRPDRLRIQASLDRACIAQLDAVLPVHSHYDHALDSAVVADLTGAQLIGGESSAFIGRGHGLEEDRIQIVTSGEQTRLGSFTVTHVESRHCPPDRYPGRITAPVVPPARTSAYRCGEAWSILVTHDGGRSALIQGSAGYIPGALAGHHADVVFLGVGQLGVQSEAYLADYWQATVRTVRAKRVVLTHWDDFFRPLSSPLRALPYAGDDLDVTIAVLGDLARADGVILQLPQLWRREDPWVDLD